MNNSPFFLLSSIPTNVIHGYYDLWLVGLSYVVAVFASYVALDMAGRLRADNETPAHKRLWLAGGALAMGAGIWSMHFIGMLAYIMPMPMSFESFYTILSMIFAILASLIALSLLKNKNFKQIHLILGGVTLGIAIALMHYTGMEAMRSHVNISYTPGLFSLSILIAIAASEAALWLALQSSIGSQPRQIISKIISALVMGVAICGMHYTGMAAAVFTPLPNAHLMVAENPVTMAVNIAVITLTIISLALLVSTYNQLMSSALKKKNDALTHAQQELQDLNATLEKRIEEKSAKLKEAVNVAESANNLKSEFLANMSHELRTPLNAIIGYTEMLQEDTAEAGHTPHYGFNLEKVQRSAIHLLELINDVLDLSKIESGKIDISLEDIKIKRFIEEIENTISPLMKNNNNQLTSTILPGIDSMYTDVNKIRQSILNLLNNASKFTKNGNITFEISPLIQNNTPWVQFLIRDTGIGIAPENISKLFQPFVQGDGSTTREFGGTGLGLYISKRFCEMLGGKISVDSQKGKGSTFIITLPLKSAARIEN